MTRFRSAVIFLLFPLVIGQTGAQAQSCAPATAGFRRKTPQRARRPPSCNGNLPRFGPLSASGNVGTKNLLAGFLMPAATLQARGRRWKPTSPTSEEKCFPAVPMVAARLHGSNGNQHLRHMHLQNSLEHFVPAGPCSIACASLTGISSRRRTHNSSQAMQRMRSCGNANISAKTRQWTSMFWKMPISERSK
ncbi:hypothetical protein QOV31_004947 (plasmid) [Agrobacterium fabrum]|nr:hypothetical protein QOV31_004947 [Agrobacterium fabrum]CAD0217044.1 hypothetical protein AGTUEHA105_LOCUS4973 [Agrobacterium tumefaciens]